jgi:hypothetical protein
MSGRGLGEKTVAYVRTREQQTAAYVTEGFMRTTARGVSANPNRYNSKTTCELQSDRRGASLQFRITLWQASRAATYPGSENLRTTLTSNTQDV